MPPLSTSIPVTLLGKPIGRFFFCVAMIMLIVGVLASTGLYNIDEFIYLSAASSMAESASLTVANGFELFPSKSLLVAFLVDGPHGLVPQYPPGHALLAAPFYAIAGIHALIALNIIAALGALIVTYKIALSIYQDENVALIGVVILFGATFWLDFAWVIWPHMLSALCVLLAILCAVELNNADNHRIFRWALWSGIFTSLGIMLRVDSVLFIPAFIAYVILFQAHYWRVIVAFGLGALPVMLAMSIINYYKFGDPIPLSYGSDVGSISLPRHFAVAVLFLLLMSALLLLKKILWTRKNLHRGVLASVMLSGLVLAVPVLRAAVIDWCHGFYSLMVDIRAIDDPRPGVKYHSDHVVTFWGATKKSLVQSMPWLGIMMGFFALPRQRACRNHHALLLLFIFFWSAPFFLLSWHGGLGSNMRYLLPLLPIFSIFGARIWVAFHGDKKVDPLLLYSCAAAIVIFLGWANYGPGGHEGAQQILPLYVFSLIALSTLTLASKRVYAMRWSIPLNRMLVSVGFGLAFIFMCFDIEDAQSKRRSAASAAEELAVIPEKSIIFGAPEELSFQVQRKNGFVAMTLGDNSEADFAWLLEAMRMGFEVFAMDKFVTQIVASQPSIIVASDPNPLLAKRYMRLTLNAELNPP